ncbi:COG4315 family predicted lipoprotein [Cumulibacter manganitolerans]|uniref:COG4315 family predicted lipoprotein n=1 Tax=Cumulibacter manganitolerans TaxID=1884992 RepID=UPI0018862780|nr:hypothetical protein [Cumulibacter manganitolerans]
MKRKRLLFAGLGLVPTAVGVLVVLNPTGSTASPQPSSTASAPVLSPDGDEAVKPPPAAVIGLAASSFGVKVVDGAGRTLYRFSLDTAGSSKCVGGCTAEWLPARSYGGKPRPGNKVSAPEVGNIKRPDGSEQITLEGYPLYYYSGDSGPGQSNGHGRSAFGGTFSAQPAAKPGG